MEDFKNLKRVAMSELRKLDSQYANKEEFSESDAKMYNCLMHGLKSQLTAEAMIDAKEMADEGYSERRGRGEDGRYISMNDHMSQKSYSDGYSQGYSEAMSRYMDPMANGASGRYPFGYPQRRW